MQTTKSQTIPVDPIIQVRPPVPGAPFGEWHISQNLTDRWGDLNFHDHENKPLQPLIDDEALLDRLRNQMVDEVTFVVRKDGVYGILFEIEFVSKESEAMEDPDGDYVPHDEVVAMLQAGGEKLAAQFPFAQFGIPHEGQVINDRPALWAFIPLDGSTDDQRSALFDALMDFAYGKAESAADAA